MNETVVVGLTPGEARQIFEALDSAFRRNGRLPYELREFRAHCWRQAHKEAKSCGSPSPDTVSGATSQPV
jgi:hypothetical protein